jgi:hypothetical protein
MHHNSIPVGNQFGMKNLEGQLFGMLTVTGPGPRLKNGKAQWHCRCACGAQLLVRHDYLLHTNSPKTHCGCKNKGPSVLHPLEYGVWFMMNVRCTDPNHVSYKHYGGRGIAVCEAWKNDFYAFLKDMGPRGSRLMSLEREDNEKGYGPDNCVWKPKKLQGRNRRGSLFLPHPVTGEKVPAAQVAEFLGISYQAMRARYVADGLWPTEAAPVAPSPGAEDEDEDSDE